MKNHISAFFSIFAAGMLSLTLTVPVANAQTSPLTFGTQTIPDQTYLLDVMIRTFDELVDFALPRAGGQNPTGVRGDLKLTASQGHYLREWLYHFPDRQIASKNQEIAADLNLWSRLTTLSSEFP